MDEVKVTVLPPGRAYGAGDLSEWASRRMVGKAGVPTGKQKRNEKRRLNSWRKDWERRAK